MLEPSSPGVQSSLDSSRYKTYDQDEYFSIPPLEFVFLTLFQAGIGQFDHCTINLSIFLSASLAC